MAGDDVCVGAGAGVGVGKLGITGRDVLGAAGASEAGGGAGAGVNS